MNPRPKLSLINHVLDEYRWLVYLASALLALGFGVLTPNVRITKLEAQAAADHQTLLDTKAYLRVLATATCLEKPLDQRVDLIRLLCERVVNDPENYRLPR